MCKVLEVRHAFSGRQVRQEFRKFVTVFGDTWLLRWMLYHEEVCGFAKGCSSQPYRRRKLCEQCKHQATLIIPLMDTKALPRVGVAIQQGLHTRSVPLNERLPEEQLSFTERRHSQPPISRPLMRWCRRRQLRPPKWRAEESRYPSQSRLASFRNDAEHM